MDKASMEAKQMAKEDEIKRLDEALYGSLAEARAEIARQSLVVAAARRYCNADSKEDAVNEWHALLYAVEVYEQKGPQA